MATIRKATIDKYKAVLATIAMHNEISKGELEQILTDNKVSKTLYKAMENAAYIGDIGHSHYRVYVSVVNDNTAIKLAQENNRLVNKSKAKKELAYKYMGELPKGLNYNPQVSIREQDIEKAQTSPLRAELNDIRAELTKVKLSIDFHISRESRRKNRPTIRQRITSAWNKFIQSLTIKS